MGSGGLGGGIYCSVLAPASQPVFIVNNTLVGNAASSIIGENGGGIAFVLLQATNQLVIANNLLTSNSSGIYQVPSTPSAPPMLTHNNLLNTRSNYINLIADPTDLNVDPGFVDNHDWHLATNSPCVDAGTNLYLPRTDCAGVPRPLDGNHDGTAAPDLGAFETVHPTADSDGDSMPDAWELAQNLNPILDDGSNDADQDGASNSHEYWAGTVPHDPASRLALELTRDPGTHQLLLRWFGAANRYYLLEYAETLPGPGTWPQLAESLPGQNTTMTWTAPAPDNPRFYRVQARLEP
jgi:hypothetical protein